MGEIGKKKRLISRICQTKPKIKTQIQKIRTSCITRLSGIT